jgi:hypothetical protein
MQGIKIALNKDSIDAVKKQFNTLLDELQKQSDNKPISIKFDEISKSIAVLRQNIETLTSKINSKPLKVFDADEIKKNNIEIYKSIDSVINKYAEFGKVTIPNKTLDPVTEELLGFTVQVEKADGVIEKLKFNLANIASGGNNINILLMFNRRKHFHIVRKICL